jgi:hypothetical protein
MKRRSAPPTVFPLADLVHRLAQVHQDVELVVQDRSLRSVAFFEGRVAERLPHVHDGQADFAAFFRTQPGKELVEAGLGAVLAAEPNGTTSLQVADHDAVLVTLGNGNLVDAKHPRSRFAGTSELLAHVLLVQLLDGVPIEEEFFGYFFDGGLSTATAHEEGEPLGIERIVGEPVEPFPFHAAAPGALDPTDFEFQVDASVAAGQVADAPEPFVVIGTKGLPADPAGGFFRRRWSEMTTAQGSPKTPRISGRGTKPRNR